MNDFPEDPRQPFEKIDWTKRQELLAGAAEQAWESICITDADLESPGPRFVYANQAFEKLMGHTESEVLGKSPRIHQGPLTDRKVLQRLKSALKAGENFHGEVINYRKNGEAFWLEWKISPVKDSNGKTTHFIAFQRDISMMKAAEQRLQDFHSVLSHELRAPLTSILGSMRLLQSFDPPQTENGKRFLDIGLESTERLIKIINDLLDLSKLESGTIDLITLPTSVENLVLAASQSLIHYRFEDKVVIDATAIDAYVLADKGRVTQVLVNLISNAMKFSPAGGHVSVSAIRAQSGMIRFSVKDDGPGISQENQSKLFSKFQQINSGDGINRSGTGLGLSTAKTIIEQHGGQIGVESTIGSGSTFWFELSEVNPNQSDSPVAESSDALKATPPKLVLLVEDDTRLSTLLKFHLEEEFFQIHCVTSVAQAEKALESLTPDVCIIDMILPDGNGLALVEKVQALRSNHQIPILMTSASRYNACELGSPVEVTWIYKPFELNEISSLIEQKLKKTWQRVVIYENSDDALLELPEPLNSFTHIVNCSDDIAVLNHKDAYGNICLKFDGSPKAENNLELIANKLTETETVVICSNGKLTATASGIVTRLIKNISAIEKLTEAQFVERLSAAL